MELFENRRIFSDLPSTHRKLSIEDLAQEIESVEMEKTVSKRKKLKTTKAFFGQFREFRCMKKFQEVGIERSHTGLTQSKNTLIQEMQPIVKVIKSLEIEKSERLIHLFGILGLRNLIQ